MKPILAVGLASLFVLAGCTGTTVTGTGGGGAGGSGGQGGTGGGDPVPGGQSLKLGPVQVAPGTENTQCIQARLGNADLLRAHQIHNVLSDGSHHLIVYRTTETEEKLTPYDCEPFVNALDPSKGSPLMITQKHDELLTLPDNVAFTLDPNQMIRLEVHFINAGAEPIEIEATADFIPIAESDFKHEAGFLFLGDPDINIPAMSTAKVGPVFLPLGKLLPEVAEQTTFFAITGHTHQWGKKVSVSVVKDKSDPGTSIYDVANWSWAEPETVKHDPGFSITKEGGFRFSCEYDNKSASTVSFGEGANDEMCFFWAYYYPSKGAFVCAHTDQASDPATGEPYVDICCPGSPYCGFLQ